MKRLVTFVRPFILQPLITSGNAFSFKRKRENFFLSFADALICILNEFEISGKKEYALLPSFYCPSTLTFFGNYLKIVLYNIHSDFTVDTEHYFEQIKKYNPRVIVNYNFLGAPLAKHERSRLLHLINDSTIIIDDCAHRILVGPELSFLNKNHFYIDSIRKHSPFLGSNVINANFQYSKKSVTKLSRYKVTCYLLQTMRGWLCFWAYVFNSRKLYVLSGEVFFLLDDLIGKGRQSAQGSRFSFYFYNFLHLVKIKEHQQKQALIYNHYFNKLKTPLIKTLPTSLVLGGELCYYPLFVSSRIQKDLLIHFNKNNVFAEKLWDPADVDYQGIDKDFYNSFIILPLNWLIKKREILRVYEETKNFLKK